VIPASLFANDMGGMTLAKTVCKSEQIGNFNAFIISSMMGCTISFNLPFALGMVKAEHYKELFFGFLCGIATVPIGCFISGLILGIHPLTIILAMLPLIVIALIVAMALIFIPRLCIKCFEILGVFMKILALSGLVISIFTFLTKVQISSHFESFENAALVCANACVTLSGALPFMLIVSRLLNKPLNTLGSRLGINGVSMLAFLGSMVTNASTFGIMEKMDKKGVMLNSAFAISAAFAFADHLAFTMAFEKSYAFPVVLAKLIGGFSAVAVACLLYRKLEKKPA
jgi:ethanolamine transporter